MKVVDMMKSFWKEEEGLTMVEYALVGALVATAAIVGFRSLGGAVSGKAESLGETITSAT